MSPASNDSFSAWDSSSCLIDATWRRFSGEVGEYGYATAYASVLIVLMVLAVILIRVLVGKRQMARRELAPAG